jgi:hypothetical protein
MSRYLKYLGVLGGIVFFSALLVGGCSGGGADSPTAPPDPFVAPPANDSVGTNTGGVEQIQGPGVLLEKATNGFDADTAPGPSIAVGDPVTWTYEITNIGDVTLVTWAVYDDQMGPDPVCSGTDLEPLLTETCTVNGTAEEGQYANLGTARASDGNEEVEASDPSHYLGGGGLFAAVELQKTTQVRDEAPDDADFPIGPIVLVGDDVNWEYTITNIGEVALESWTISDDQIGEICTGTSLAIDATASCSATGTAVAGQYANIGLVEASDGTADILDEDPSHYFGSDPAIAIDKLTNGEDGPVLIIGCPVTWTYEVTNIGNIDLAEIAVVDDQGVAVTCPDDTLAPDDSFTCSADGLVQDMEYTNLGTVTAVDPIGTPVDSDDESSYIGTDQCANVLPSEDSLWPPNHRMETIELSGDICGGDSATITITAVTQDEPVNGLGDGDTSPDAVILGGGMVELRRERAGGGNGRVYEISFDAVNGAGVGCSGSVFVGVPHDQSGSPPVDDGQDYDSLQE